MHFLTDENVYEPMVEALRNLGHDVFDIKQEKLTGAADDEVYRLSQSQNRILISMDKDFTNILRYPPGRVAGIIVLKLYRMTVLEATTILIDAISQLSEDDIKHNLVIIDKNKTRIRREN